MAIQRRVDAANERHRKALKALRAEKLESAAVKTKAKLQREKVMEKEKIRAATVAAMPKAKEDPIEDLPKQKLPEVRLHDQTNQNRTTFYEQPVGVVEAATDFDTFETAFESAKIDAEEYEAEKRAEKVKFNENSGKSVVRGTAALKKLRLEGARNNLEEHLEALRRREVQLRGSEAHGPLHSNAAAFSSDKAFNKRAENQRQYQMETLIEQAFNTRRELLPDNELDISTEESEAESSTALDLLPAAKRHTDDIQANIITDTEGTATPSKIVESCSSQTRKEHTVRFSDEEKKLIQGFQEQKAEMERILSEARLEHQVSDIFSTFLSHMIQRQMAEIEGAMKKVKDVSINSSSQSKTESQNSTLTAGVTETLDAAQANLAQIKQYQNRLLEKYKAETSTINDSSVLVKELSTLSEVSQSEDKSSKECFNGYYELISLYREII